ncbi:MAG: hypothetical protein QOF89_3880 [Acidobacteriota bacterium]|jgi:hypothetical protein|nr:hypothetical protein [Acidobacteriota bacterium]
MTPEPTPGRRWTARWKSIVWRAGLALTALGLAFAASAELRSLQAAREEAFAGLQRARVSLDAADLDREPDPERVRLRTARALVAAELDPARGQGLPPQELGRQAAQRMAEAAQAGADVLARRPASWEAAQVLGAATYIGWAQSRDPRLFTDYRRWEAPLEAALRLAPARREPTVLLAAAYLEVWPALSPRKRAIARRLLAETFRNTDDLGRLLEPWLDRAADRREAFSVLPDDPAGWERVADALGRRGDWEGYDAARRRGDEALLGALNRDLLTADRLRSGGALNEARTLYLKVAQRARPEARFQPLLERALERCPPGPVDTPTSERLKPLLDQALDRCLIAGCEIEPVALKRLSHFVRQQDPQQEALATLFAGDLPGAALFERRTQGLGTEPWAPYLLAKARVLAARGRVEEAREALSLVYPSWQGRPLYWQTRAEVAQAAGDRGAQAEAEARLAAFARRSWPAGAWTLRQGIARLEMVTDGPAAGLTVDLDQAPKGGTVLELRLDGAGLGAFPVPPAAGATPPLRLPVPLGSGLHVLEIVNAQQVVPGAAVLR